MQVSFGIYVLLYFLRSANRDTMIEVVPVKGILLWWYVFVYSNTQEALCERG